MKIKNINTYFYRNLLKYIKRHGVDSLYDSEDLNQTRFEIVKIMSSGRADGFKMSDYYLRNEKSVNNFISNLDALKIDKYIKNLKVLENLDIKQITFTNDVIAFSERHCAAVYFKKNKVKAVERIFSDVKEEYNFSDFIVEYSDDNILDLKVDFKKLNPSWMIASQVHENVNVYTYMYMKNLDFDNLNLPSKKELCSKRLYCDIQKREKYIVKK